MAFFFIGLLASSCSKEEYNQDDIDRIPGPPDTIIVEDKVILNVGGVQTQLSGIYSECIKNQGQIETSEYTHILAYADGLNIEETEVSYNGPLYLLYWTSSEKLTEGVYLVEGIVYDDNTGQEENVLYKLFITEVSEFFIEGQFESQSSSIDVSSGEFRTTLYSCENLNLDGEEFVEYADGRMTLSIDSGDDDLLMSVIAYCDDAFEDKPGQAKLLFGGGAFYFDGDEITFDEDPELLIIFDLDNGPIVFGESFKAYYLDDLEDLLNSSDDPNYNDLIQMSSEISVTITSETENYLTGTYIGQLKDGRKVEGTFRANIARDC